VSQRLTSAPLAAAVAATVNAWESFSGDSTPTVSLMISFGEVDGMGRGYDQAVNTISVPLESSSR